MRKPPNIDPKPILTSIEFEDNNKVTVKYTKLVGVRTRARMAKKSTREVIFDILSKDPAILKSFLLE